MFFTLIHTSALMDSDSIWQLRNGEVQRIETCLIIALKFNITETKGEKKYYTEL